MYRAGEAGAERLRYARLAAAASDEAARQGLLSERDRVIRRANLAWFYLRQPGGDVRDVVDPDVLARDALAAMPVPLTVAAGNAADWTSLPPADIADLRSVKNLLTAVAPLLDHLRDVTLRGELAW